MSKLTKALLESAKKRKDTTPMERLENSKVKATIEGYCDKYLKSSEDIFMFEALPSAIHATIAYLESKDFSYKYEYAQVSETCFKIRLRDLNILY